MIKRAYKPKIGSKRATLYEYVLKNPGLTAMQLHARLKLHDDAFMVTRELNILKGFEVVREDNGRFYEYVPEPEIITEVVVRQPMVFKGKSHPTLFRPPACRRFHRPAGSTGLYR